MSVQVDHFTIILKARTMIPWISIHSGEMLCSSILNARARSRGSLATALAV